MLQLTIPAGLISIANACVLYIRNYTSMVTFDNFYLNHQFKLIDQLKRTRDDNDRANEGSANTNCGHLNEKGCRNARWKNTNCVDNRCSGMSDDRWEVTSQCGYRLLPLKNYEKLFIADATRWRPSAREIGMAKSGMCSFFLLISLTFFIYGIDFVLYSMLFTASSSIDNLYKRSGGNRLEDMVEGNGNLAQFIDLFLKHFHPPHWLELDGQVGDNQFDLFNSTGENETTGVRVGDLDANSRVLCQADTFFISLPLFISVVCIEFILSVAIFSKAKLFRLRNSIVGYFYKDVQNIRINYLHDALSKQRSNLQSILCKVVRTNHDQRHSTFQPSLSTFRTQATCLNKTKTNGYNEERNRFARFFYNISSTLKTKLLFSKFRCYVCNGYCTEHVLCPTEGCCGSYCQSCFDDLSHSCPLCCHSHDDQQSISTKVDP